MMGMTDWGLVLGLAAKLWSDMKGKQTAPRRAQTFLSCVSAMLNAVTASALTKHITRAWRPGAEKQFPRGQGVSCMLKVWYWARTLRICTLQYSWQ